MSEKQGNLNKTLVPILGIMLSLIVGLVILLVIVLSAKKDLKPQLEAMKVTTEETPEKKENIQIYLPENYYVAAGITMEIYNSQITNKCSYISDYNVRWVCEVGENLKRKYRIASTEDMIGDYELKVQVYDTAMNLLAEETTILKIVEPVLENSFSLLQIGDGLSCDGMLYSRLQSLSNEKIVFNGTRHIDECGECHPFYNLNTETLDWNYYCETTGFYPDVVQIFLGTNDILGAFNVDDIVAIVDAIRTDDAMTQIYVVNTIFKESQNGLGEYLSKGWNEQEQDFAVYNLMVELSEKLTDYEDIYLVPAGISMDSEYNYEHVDVIVNPYSNSRESYEIDQMHLNKDGYYQIADVMFSTFCGTMQ